MEIFKISQDQDRIELLMPFDICRNPLVDGYCLNKDQSCSNIHMCYDYFYGNSCQQMNNCPYPHFLTKKLHADILGPLISLDLDALTKAFRVYCQSKKQCVNHSMSQGQQQVTLNLSMNNNLTPPSVIDTWRTITVPQINGNISWKVSSRLHMTSKTYPKQQIVPGNYEGLQICWKPKKDIQTHFIEVIFSNENKSDGGSMLTHQIYQHLGIAQVFYRNLDVADRVVHHGPVTFQSFTFNSRLLHQISDVRHICFANIPPESERIGSYIDVVSRPYKINQFTYYQNDPQMIVVEYNEDVDFCKIYSNVRNYPECDGSMISCIQLYLPETLLIEYDDHDYSEDNFRQLFDDQVIFHIKTYPHCAFVHFYSHADLVQSLEKTSNSSIRMIPIYTNIFSLNHLHDYLRRKEMEQQTKLTLITPVETNEIIAEEPPKDESSSETPPSVPILTSLLAVDEQTGTSSEQKASNQQVQQAAIATNGLSDSDDDFHDLPSEFDDEDLLLDELAENNGEMEFVRTAAKSLMSSLAEMEGANTETTAEDAPHSLSYADDFLITIKNRRFALAFLDYTLFRIEKNINTDKFRMLLTLRKRSRHKKRSNHNQQPAQASSETKSKKKRNKRNKKKQDGNPNPTEGITSHYC
ncbi:unnamed protein product [Adineta ricciae]|uniref:C3H1-type domain-containing protein n=1 Tax=Adineta ricciae TaxID=249248 RepID=A0A816D4I8_ADIRI|nr:unnamed protein product [Adineta ricciae]